MAHKAKTLLAAAAAGLALAATSASADVQSDCKESRDGELRIRACGQIIDARTASPSLRAEAYRARASAYAARAATREAIADYSEA